MRPRPTGPRSSARPLFLDEPAAKDGNHRADHRIDDMAEVSSTEEKTKLRKQHAADQTADGTDDQIGLCAVTVFDHDLVGQPADDGASTQPKNNDFHECFLLPLPSTGTRNPGRRDCGGNIAVIALPGKRDSNRML